MKFLDAHVKMLRLCPCTFKYMYILYNIWKSSARYLYISITEIHILISYTVYLCI